MKQLPTKPLHGQRQFFDLPVVVYCRRCGRRLRSARAMEQGAGRKCSMAMLARQSHTPAMAGRRILFVTNSARIELLCVEPGFGPSFKAALAAAGIALNAAKSDYDGEAFRIAGEMSTDVIQAACTAWQSRVL